MVADVSYLEVPVMAPSEASRQLGIPASTLKHWLDGHHVGSRFYPPVLRPESSPGADVTWGEMVEADYLRAYRSKAYRCNGCARSSRTAGNASTCAIRSRTFAPLPTGAACYSRHRPRQG